MRWRISILLLLPASNYAQMTPSEVLRRVKDAYAGATQYQFAARIVETRKGVETTGSDELVVDKRGRVWFKAAGSAAFAFSGGREEIAITAVADGREVWVYLEGLKLFKKAAGTPDPPNSEAGDDSMDNPTSYARKIMDGISLRYAKFESMSNRAKILPEESCTANGVTSQCYVVEIAAETSSPQTVNGIYTLWIEKKRYLVLRDDFRIVSLGTVTYANSIFYDTVKMNDEVPARSFSFTPPDAAREVSSFFQ